MCSSDLAHSASLAVWDVRKDMIGREEVPAEHLIGQGQVALEHKGHLGVEVLPAAELLENLHGQHEDLPEVLLLQHTQSSVHALLHTLQHTQSSVHTLLHSYQYTLLDTVISIHTVTHTVISTHTVKVIFAINL